MLPKNLSLRTKQITINTKEIILKPWNNLTYSNFVDLFQYNKDKFEQIEEYLINPFIETKHKLTLDEKRTVFFELYRLSKGNVLDITFRCEHCNTDSKYTVFLDKISKIHNLKESVVKTEKYIFNLKKYSNYCINYKDNQNEEALKYLSSFVREIDDGKEVYPITDLNELVEWMRNEIPSKDFEDFITKMNDILPYTEIDIDAVCEYCLETTKLNFRGIESFLKF